MITMNSVKTIFYHGRWLAVLGALYSGPSQLLFAQTASSQAQALAKPTEVKTKKPTAKKQNAKDSKAADKKAEPVVKTKKGKLSPTVRAQVKRSNQNYKQCITTALAQMKQETISASEFKSMTTSCRERFPGASLYIECKKAAIKKHKDKGAEFSAAVSQCKQQLIASSFNADEPIPFYLHNEKLNFAGIGLNTTQNISDFAPPNFDCSRLKEKTATPQDAEFILFGNHPAWFEKFNGKVSDAQLQQLKVRLPVPDEGQYIPGFGQLFGNPRKKDSTVFFPSSNCSFSGDLGPHFSGLTAYYLLDEKAKTATPYFAIAFYKPQIGDPTITVDQIVAKLQPSFGKNSVVTREPGDTKTILADEKITSFDEEGDPRNVCKPPRKHKFIAVIKARTLETPAAEFVLIANIAQLCDFGDRLSRRL